MITRDEMDLLIGVVQRNCACSPAAMRGKATPCGAHQLVRDTGIRNQLAAMRRRSAELLQKEFPEGKAIDG